MLPSTTLLSVKHASLSRRIPSILAGIPFPWFNSMGRATNFVEHHIKSIPRFSMWLCSGPLILAYAAWPAILHNFDEDSRPEFLPDSPPTAASSAPVPENERLKAAGLVDEDAPKIVAGVDFSPVGVLQQFPTRFGTKYVFKEAEGGDGEDGEEFDEMPVSIGPDKKILMAAHLAAQAKANAPAIAANEAAKLSVDALKRFDTRPGALYIFDDSEDDLIPVVLGAKNPFKDDDDDDDDDE